MSATPNDATMYWEVIFWTAYKILVIRSYFEAYEGESTHKDIQASERKGSLLDKESYLGLPRL
jgi:hypothetical protein